MNVCKTQWTYVKVLLPYLEDIRGPRTNTPLVFLFFMVGFKIEDPSHFLKIFLVVIGCGCG